MGGGGKVDPKKETMNVWQFIERNPSTAWWLGLFLLLSIGSVAASIRDRGPCECKCVAPEVAK